MYPRCLTNLAKTYLSANGYVLPCCWLGNRPDIYELEKFLEEDFKQLHISNFKYPNTAWDKIKQSWKTESFFPCVQHCKEYKNRATNDKRQDI
jgi:hypothetical protein